MAGTLVFIFLLDHLPENIMNKSLETVQVTHTVFSRLKTCDITITDPLLQVISRELEVLLMPSWLAHERSQAFTKISKEISGESSNETSLHRNKVIESSLEAIRDATIENYKLEDYEHALDSSSENWNNKEKTISDQKLFSQKAPLLAAIFESLSNVTAQTCGGSVVAPHWVLTAASCINLLSNLNAETTNITEKSVYTIIVNATDPLIDGSAHNVTEIYVHPQDGSEKPKVALLKIDPGVEVEEVKIVDSRDVGMHVTVHGWAMTKVDTEHDTMLPTTFRAITITPEDCATYYNITADSSELCMATSDEYRDVISQLSWGGPVVSRSGGLLAVAHGDGRAPLVAWPLAPHATWLHNITKPDNVR